VEPDDFVRVVVARELELYLSELELYLRELKPALRELELIR